VGRIETGEMPTLDKDTALPVDRGQRDDRRRFETPGTYVVWLITQRSQVQILPPLPRSEAGSENGSGFLRCEAVVLSSRLSGSLLRSIPGTASGSW
jgi:hypothetical protein